MSVCVRARVRAELKKAGQGLVTSAFQMREDCS